MGQKLKPIDTISLAISLVDFFKSAAIVLGMTIIEWARAKQAHAEDRQAVAESDLKIEKAKNEIDKTNSSLSPGSIIRKFLDKRKGPGA